MLKYLTAGLLIAVTATSTYAQDFGQQVDDLLASQSASLFGINAPLASSAAPSDGPYRMPDQPASHQIALADGLSASYLTREVAHKLDMYALFPVENPTHMIACIESSHEEIITGKLNPSVQSVALDSGAVKTLLRGMDRCDGIRATAWGTVLATEESGDGGAYEILAPLTIENVVINNRATGDTSDPAHVIKRTALPTMAWEGLTITKDGVVIGGDELRPGTASDDADGGAIFKFIPAKPHTSGMIASLDASPFTAGTTYAMQVECRNNKIQFGQGCEIGNATWIEIDPANARISANAKGATAYYRPEDLHADPTYSGEGVRFCWTNTGNEGGKNFAEVLCGVDTTPLEIAQPDGEGKYTFTTVVNRFVEGDTDFNSMDNLAFQPKTGILYVIEDHSNGDIWACLPDGHDRDIKTDGCIRVLSVKDSSAEPTGFMFSNDGLTAYLSIQHSFDGAMEMVDDYGTDDFIIITGFKAPTM